MALISHLIEARNGDEIRPAEILPAGPEEKGKIRGMREGCWKDSFESTGHEHKVVLLCYASRKGENGPEGDSDIIMATT